MKRKKIISVIAVIMAILMALSLVASVIPSVFAVSQYDIDQLKKKKEELSAKVQEAEERVNVLKDEQANVLDQKTALEEKNEAAKESLQIVGEEIAAYDEIIAEKTVELNAALDREQVQLDKYRTRVRAMEESGGYNILNVVMSSSDFNEFLTALDDMEKIMNADRDLEDQYIAAREEAEAVKADYEAVKADCEAKQEVLREEQAGIEENIRQTEQELAALEDKLEEAIQAYEEFQAAEEQAANQIAAMIAAYEEEKAAARAAAQIAAAQAAQAAAQQGGGEGGEGGSATGNLGLNPGAATGTGSLSWPAPFSTRVTSRYGTRSDPFTGESRSHSGIDIDGYGCEGSAVTAADGGTVITATYNDGYGNYIIIDHGNGMQTLYAHLSGMAVGEGSSVSQGQTIGYVGATGRATGTHLHFEVFVNGSRTDPAGYFGGLSYYNC